MTGDNVVQTAVLEDLSTAVHYRRWLASLAAPYLGPHPLEIGSGTGDYALEWAPACETFTCSEAEPERLSSLRKRFSARPDIRVVEMMVPITARADHSAVVAFNVLEHIPDDVGALKAMAALVEPSGRVVLVVPAFTFAMSRFDREIGHQRRYTRRSLSAAVVAAGLQIERIHYVNAVGLIAWILMMKVLRRRPQAGPALTVYDRLLVPVLERLESGRKPPFGQSLLVVARTPAS